MTDLVAAYGFKKYQTLSLMPVKIQCNNRVTLFFIPFQTLPENFTAYACPKQQNKIQHNGEIVLIL